MAFVRFLTMLAWAAVFVVLLLFAVKNADPVTLRFYFDQAWQAPLVAVVLASFAVGAVCGLVACLPVVVRHRREIARLQKELRLRPAEPGELQQPAPPLVTDVPSSP